LGAGCLLVGGAISVGFVVARGEDEGAPTTTTRAARTQVARRVEDLAARVLPGTRVALRSRPGGPVLPSVAAATEVGSPLTLPVALRKGDWIAVRSTALGNRGLGWARAQPLRLVRRPVRLEVDLSQRVLVVRDDGVARRTISVAIGAPDTPTPT